MIGSEGLGVVIRDLRVYRDVYYASANDTNGGQVMGRSWQMAGDEYFVLGDNSPISDDSRKWPDRGAIASKLLLGKPFVAIPSFEATPWGRWHFQVPNPARIRYIH